MFRRFPPFLLAAVLAVSLAGCQENAAQGVQSMQNAVQARQAVQQHYNAGRVNATVHDEGSGASRLEVVLINPGGNEAMNQRRARTVGAVAQNAYGSTLDSVRVSFEYSSQSGSAQVGFHRRYSFAPSELEGAAGDTTATGSTADTASVSPQP